MTWLRRWFILTVAAPLAVAVSGVQTTTWRRVEVSIKDLIAAGGAPRSAASELECALQAVHDAAMLFCYWQQICYLGCQGAPRHSAAWSYEGDNDKTALT